MIKLHNQTKLKIFTRLCCIVGCLVFGVEQTHASAVANTAKELFTVKDNQDRTITGTITSSDDNSPLPGVNVIVQGTTNGTVTDFDGNYAITVSSSDSILEFSSIGFATQEIAVGGNSTINVSLDPDLTNLDEVVVVGYGERKRESLTGAIEQVSSEVFQDRAVTNAALALQGQTPGLVVNRSSARPGNDEIALNIRGASSINGGSPLIVIDGAPVFNNNEFFQMNPDDIENISVLKDGSASIYGSRAANGVILVTTKKGKGKMKIEYNGNVRFNFLGLRPPVMTMQEYGQIWLEAVEQDGTGDYWGWSTEENVQRMANGEAGFYDTQFWGTIYLAPSNRYDELYGSNSGHQQTLSISGSSDEARYRLSFGLSDTQGALKTAYDGVKQYNVRLNTDYDITDKLNLGAGITFQRTNTSAPSSQLAQSLVSQDAPIFPSKNPFGQWYANFGACCGGTNSIAGTTDGGRNEQVEDLAKITLTAKYDIGSGFSVNANATFNQVSGRTDLTLLNVPVYGWNEDELAASSINRNPRIDVTNERETYQTYGAFLNYSITQAKHTVSAMVGLTAEKRDYQRLFARRLGLDDQGIYDLNVATGTQTNAGNQENEGLYSTLSRINYDYDGKYLLELVGRRDGSSRFAPGFKYSNFGSVSAGWNIHKENFMADFENLSNFKLRASFGSSGNQVGIGLVDYVSTIGNNTTTLGVAPQLVTTSVVNGITTTLRTWENVEIKNLALEFGFFNQRLTGTFEVFQKNNYGMLAQKEQSQVLGGTAPATNIGHMRTKGWEAILNYRGQIGEDFTYNVGLNMSDNNNEVIRVEGQTSVQAGFNPIVEGFPINAYFGYETDGLFQTQAEVDQYYTTYTGGDVPVQGGNTGLRPGDTRRVDLNGDGEIDDFGTISEMGDIKFLGDNQLHYTFGINLGANYKNFDFTAFFQGALEQKFFRDGFQTYPFQRVWSNQTNAYIGQSWTPENTGAAYPRLTTNGTRAGWNWNNNDFFLQDNRYMRLKTLILGYTLPSDFTEKFNMDKVRFYFSGNDLFEFSAVKDGFDPEAGNTSTNVTGPNRTTSNREIYPFQRTIAFGVNLIF
nr:TonB-dependent receptor [uncultured Allomuricauda sp.]